VLVAAEPGLTVRQVGELVGTAIKHARPRQAADSIGEVRQSVVGQNKGFEFCSLPDPCRDNTEPLLPKRDIWFSGVLHQVTLAPFDLLAKFA
jgi:hypothetical protein